MIKTLFFICLTIVLSFTSCFRNTIISPNVAKDFEKEKVLLTPFLKEIVTNLESEIHKENATPSGYVIYLMNEIDTLNLDELKKSDTDYSKITSINGKDPIIVDGDKMAKEKMDGKSVDWCSSSRENEFINITIQYPFIPEKIIHKTNGEKFKIILKKRSLKGEHYKLKPDDSFSSEVEIPIKIKSFKINRKDLNIKGPLYGFCDFETSIYYKASPEGKGELLQLKKRLKYYFKVNI